MDNYKQKILNFLSKLNDNGFIRKTDIIGEYNKDSDIYIRKISQNKFIIFVHFNKKRRFEIQGFDCYISSYDSEKEIEKEIAIQKTSIPFNINLETDWNLMDSYL